jgi:uncharacterized protein (TIGR02453 family)
MSFVGFPKQGFTFLSRLAKNNNREWFREHKGEYEEFLLEPAMNFVDALGVELRKFAPGTRAEPRVNGSIQRIYRDTRFSKDKTPYKTHMAMGLPIGAKRGEGAGFYLYLTPKGVGLGGGRYMFDKPSMLRYREAVDDPKTGAALARAVSTVRKAGLTVEGQSYKRVPPPYPQDHARGDLLRHGGIYAWSEHGLPAEVHTKAFPAWCARELKRSKPLLDWLVAFEKRAR